MIGSGWIRVGCGAALAAVLSGCATTVPKRPDAGLSQSLLAAQSATAAGEWAAAAAAYGVALDRARVLDDDAAVAGCAYNRGVCLGMAGETNRALAMLAEARFEARADSNLVARAALAETRLLRESGRVGGAEAALAPALAAYDHLLRAQALWLSAALALDDGRIPEARTRAALAERVSRGRLPAEWAPLVWSVRAPLARAAGRPAEAARASESEAKAWVAQSGGARPAASALQSAAHDWREAGRVAEAAACLYRAGRVLAGAGFQREADAVLEQAAATAADAGDGNLAAQAERLRKPPTE